MGRRTRVVAVVAGAAAAAVAVGLAVPSAGAASSPTTGNAAAVSLLTVKRVTPVKTGTSGKQRIDPRVAAAAKRFGLSATKIEQALIDIKMSFAAKGSFPKAGLLDPVVVRMFAGKLRISTSKATAVLKFLAAGQKDRDKGKIQGDKLAAEAIAYLAKALHISTARATALAAQLDKLNDRNGLTEKNPQFAKLAASVGVSPKRLIDVLVAMKKALAQDAGKPGAPKPGQPKPGQPAPKA
jgi:hypothetical protein